MSDTSPYAPPAPSEALRVFKPDPRKHIFSKWSLIKWATYFICLGMVVLIAVDTNRVNQIAKSLILGMILLYYFSNLYSVNKMEETWNVWAYRIRLLRGKKVHVVWDMDDIELGDACPLEKIFVVIPGVMVILMMTGEEYFTLHRGFPKANITENNQTLEYCIKKFLDGLTENLIFASTWYTVSNPKKNTQKLIKEASERKENSKATDIHLQGLGMFVDNDNRVQIVGKQIYTTGLGKCRDINQAISQFKSIVPGLEEKLSPSLESMYRITNVEEIIGIFKEMYGPDEVVD
jgi:hypothetical protein